MAIWHRDQLILDFQKLPDRQASHGGPSGYLKSGFNHYSLGLGQTYELESLPVHSTSGSLANSVVLIQVLLCSSTDSESRKQRMIYYTFSSWSLLLGSNCLELTSAPGPPAGLSDLPAPVPGRAGPGPQAAGGGGRGRRGGRPPPSESGWIIRMPSWAYSDWVTIGCQCSMTSIFTVCARPRAARITTPDGPKVKTRNSSKMVRNCSSILH